MSAMLMLMPSRFHALDLWAGLTGWLLSRPFLGRIGEGTGQVNRREPTGHIFRIRGIRHVSTVPDKGQLVVRLRDRSPSLSILHRWNARRSRPPAPRPRVETFVFSDGKSGSIRRPVCSAPPQYCRMENHHVNSRLGYLMIIILSHVW